jgi:molybdate transport system regulatory protein
MKSKPTREPQLQPRVRIVRGEEIALGPGKVDLLARIGETGSIRQAAERMRMSYIRAWILVRTMNRCFQEPLVESTRGGKTGGGAHLTETGGKVLELYRRMERDCFASMNQDWESLKRLLRK